MRGGPRKGAGRIAGVCSKLPQDKRVQVAISMPAKIKAKLKENHSNISKYVLNLIKADYETRGQSL